ncbi:MAG: hypothetical protein WA951_06775 [Leeuwenhoekiella sp.]
MKKNTFLFIFVLALLSVACGATPGISTGDEAISKEFPSYHYQDAEGNLYDITQQKYIYTPVSPTNSIDGVTDEGLYTELNISINDFTKIAAVCEEQLQRNQEQLTDRDPNIPLPFLRREGGENPKQINIDYKAVNSLNYILEPYLDE